MGVKWLAVWAWAHPRSRGENFAPVIPILMEIGSSPLTRGKPGSRSTERSARRLIPAHAGKTVSFDFLPFPARAHPRSRGENSVEEHIGISEEGSSPLTRGKLGSGRQGRQNRGLIPAHAGKTSQRPSPRALGRAHPRSRGENVTEALDLTGERGSSPLTRGKRFAV